MAAVTFVMLTCDGTVPETGEPCDAVYRPECEWPAATVRRRAGREGWRTTRAGGRFRDLCPAPHA